MSTVIIWKPRLAIAILIVGAMFAGCTLPMRPVNIDAAPADWRSLSGTWHGEYWARAYDRHGTIALRLTASPEDASGEVLMIADESGWPYRRYAPTSGAAPVEPFTELLTIRFVRAVDAQISGDLEPYWDPDRRCQASATFRGKVDANNISGTFTSRCVDDITRIVSGRWTVHRRPVS